MLNISWADIEDEEDEKKIHMENIKFPEFKKRNKKIYCHKDKIYINNKWIKTQNLTRENRELSQPN